MASLCNEIEPHESWTGFGPIDYDASVEGLQSWLLDNHRESPPPFPMHDLFFTPAMVGRPSGAPDYLQEHVYAIRMHGWGPPPDEHRLVWQPANDHVHPPALTELSSRISNASAAYVMPPTYVLVAVGRC